MLIHPQEALLQQARALQQSTQDEYRVRRVVVEHRLARLVQLGKSRYFGRVKTRFQLYLAATANLLVAGKLGRSGRTGGGATGRIVPYCCGQFLRGPARNPWSRRFIAGLFGPV